MFRSNCLVRPLKNFKVVNAQKDLEKVDADHLQEMQSAEVEPDRDTAAHPLVTG